MGRIASFDDNDRVNFVNIIRDSEDHPDGREICAMAGLSDKIESVILYTIDGDHSNSLGINYSDFDDFVEGLIELRETLYDRGDIKNENRV